MRRLPLAVLALAIGVGSVAVGLPAEAAIARPTQVAVAKGGVYNTGVRIQWKWAKKVRYEVQAASDTRFTRLVADVDVAARSTRPSAGLMATTVKKLPNATKLNFRVRSISSTGSVSSWSTRLQTATKVATPSGFTGTVSATPGPGAGELTFHWKHDGANTTAYELETALTLFSKTDSSMPLTGRHSRTFAIDPQLRSFTLTADQVAEAGAPLGSGNHLLYRFSAINTGTAGTKVRRYPKLGSVRPVASTTADSSATSAYASSTAGSSLRVATFNVRTAKATTDARNWLQRADSVASSIIAKDPDVVALQELGPGRADGQAGTTDGTPRQTDSLETALANRQASRYQLVRTTPYVKSGTVHSTQGARILYDTTRLTLLSDCPEVTGTSKYSASCAMELPILSDDTEARRRSAAYAKFKDKSSGAAFWFVSVHLDERHSELTSTETRYNRLRGDQTAYALRTVDALNTSGLPVVMGGDFNSWQNNAVGDAPKDTLLADGYVDTASVPHAINLQYATYNNFAVTQKVSGYGYGPRLDGLFVRGGTATTHENVTKPTDTARPSDHNLVVADVEV